MSKKSKKRPGTAVKTEAPRRTRRPKLIAAAVAACIVLTAAAATRLEPVRLAVGLAPLAPTAPQAGGLQVAKEYVYVNGRLVATEEAAPTTTPTPTGTAPSALVATASFPNATTAVVSLTWSAPASGDTPLSYVVERAENRTNGAPDYAPLAQTAPSAPTAAAPYVDQTAAPNKVYLYHVKAVYAAGFSPYSNQDLSTTVRYTGDDPLVRIGDPQGRPASKVRAANLTELRSVIDAVRSLAGLGAAPWGESDPAPADGGAVRAVHFSELRAQLNQALSALDIGQMPTEASAIAANQPVRAAHIQDVREKVR